MKRKTKSIGVNFTGYPTSSSEFIVDNGLLVMIDALIKEGHETVAIDYNVPSIIDDMRVPQYLQPSLERIISRLLDSDKKDPGLIAELNSIELEIERERIGVIKKKAKDLVDYYHQNNMDFIWMKLWTGDGFKYSAIMADEIKKLDNHIKIAAGGPHVRLFREKTYKFTRSFDIINYGEGEIILPMIAQWVLGEKDIDSIPNTLYISLDKIIDTKGQGLITSDKLSEYLLPDDFHGYYGKRYIGLDQKILIGFTETSRGCPEKHIFCQHSANSGDCWRLIDEDTVISNFRKYYENGIKANRIPDSNPPQSHLKKIYGSMKKKGIHLDMISAFCEIPEFSKELGQSFVDVGGFSLFFGIESGSYSIRKSLGKNYTSQEILSKIDIAKNLGIRIAASFMVPSIGENDSTVAETRKMIETMAPDYLLIGPTIPMGEILKQPERFGYELGEDFYDEFQFYSPRLHLPPTLRKKLPVKLNGIDWTMQNQISSEVTKDLPSNIHPYVSDELAMVARLTEEPINVFLNRFNDALRKGDSEIISQYIEKINRNK